MYRYWYFRNKKPFTFPLYQILEELNIGRQTHFDIVERLKRDNILATEKTNEVPPKVLYNFELEPDQLVERTRCKATKNTKVRYRTYSIYNNRVFDNGFNESVPSGQRSLRDRFREHFQKEKNYKYTREKLLLDFWNSQGQPLIKHKQGSKAWNKALDTLKEKLEVTSPAEIKSRIVTYHRLLSESYYLRRQYEHANALGVRVGIADFIKPSTYTRKGKFSPALSWFAECGKPFEDLARTYLSANPDYIPHLQYFWTEELRRSPADEYQLARVSEKLSKFEKLHSRRFNFTKGANEPTKKKLTRYLFEALSDANRQITLTTLLFGVDDYLKDYLERRLFMQPERQVAKRKPKRRVLKRINPRCEEELLELDEHLEQLRNRSLPE